MNNYSLEQSAQKKRKTSIWSAVKNLLPFMNGDRRNITLAVLAAFVSSALNLLSPVMIGHVVDTYIAQKQFQGVLIFSAILLAMYLTALLINYFQTMLMGRVGQNILFNLRNTVFNKLQELPTAFFNQNKAGDLISRINNDTDKLNQFFSQSLIQFIANIMIILGAAIFLLTINWRVGAAVLSPALFLLLFTRLLSPWIKNKNAISLKSLGGMSGEISESLDNFKVVVAFNRRDYFRRRFNQVNQQNYQAAIGAGIANNTLTPTYGLASNVAQIILIAYGIFLISTGDFTIGLLISFLAYINRLYDPLRQMASIWSSFQTALAAWDRIHAILLMKSDLVTIEESHKAKVGAPILEFRHVHFGYPNGKEVLHNISLSLEHGKTYALVGPTGGGKTTTASLMARLYDPTKGTIWLEGKDIRSYDDAERSQKIGFILQEPFLFTGTVKDNILYGNSRYAGFSNEQLETVIKENGLEALLDRFDQKLETKVSAAATLSLGQKQLIAFIRAVLRYPDILILDEATANIDTVTEQLLENILKKLPKSTTRVIIAHRLNTIENADEIFFINAGEVIPAGSMEQAVEMLLHGKRKS